MGMRNRGYSLVEILVALAVFALFMIGILNLLDTSSRLSRVETALADTQENTRFAAYHIMRTARMMGGAQLAFAADLGTGAQWVGGQLRTNQTGTIAIPFDNVTVLTGADVLTLRGFFEIPPFFTDRTDFGFSGANTVRIRESNALGTLINDFSSFSGADLFRGRGIMFMGRGQYAVGQVAAATTIAGVAPNRTMTINLEGTPNAAWSGLNPAGVYPPVFDVYRAGILESYTYYVRPDLTLMRMRADASAGGGTSQPVAVNIGGLQIALGVDTDDDGLVDSWQAAPTAAGVAPDQVLGMRITVLGRTPFGVPDWTEPAETFAVEDMNINVADRGAKWRRIEVAAALRNYLL